MSLYVADDYPKGAVPRGRYAGGGRAPIVWVRLCAACAGFAPFTHEDYAGALSGVCHGCGGHSRELHRFAAYVDSRSGCSCDTHGAPCVGELQANLGGDAA